MERRHVDDENKGRDGGALWDTKRDWCEGGGGSLEGKAAGAVSEKGADPLYEIGANTFMEEQGEKNEGLNIVNAAFYI